MPSKISTAREFAYLRALAETGNATLAAQAAGVSRSWAYKRHEVDARFGRLCLEMVALARARRPIRVNRDRVGGWTAAKEARFVERLRETCSVWIAAAAVGLSTVSAYRRRAVRPAFAAAWDEAERTGWPPADQPWIESALCFFQGREPPPGNPVRITSIDDVLEALKGNRFVARRPRRRG
jgi:hypothetical protein